MKGYKSETIEAHLSSLRTAHLTRGVDPPNLRPTVVQQLLKGNRNLKNLEDSGLGRASVDIQDLTVMRQNLRKMGFCKHDTVLLWFALLCMFYGSLRLHEVFPHKKSEYDPRHTLLRNDIELKEVIVEGSPVEVLMISIKSPKEAQGSSVKVELFANGTKYCPVNAYKKLLNTWGRSKRWAIPLMTRSNGTLWSGRELNKLLVPLTKGISKPGGKRILSHSFRSGIPTLMARAGYSDGEIQRQGRWRSSAFLAYCKLGRAARWRDQLKLSKRISNLYIRCVPYAELNLMLILDNFDSDQDGCSELEEDCVLSTMDDSLLDDSVMLTTPAASKRPREDDNPHVTRPVVPNPVGAQAALSNYRIPRVAPVSEQAKETSPGSITISTSDGQFIHMGDFMKVVMKQMENTNKVLAKDEESESKKRLRLAETEASFN